MPGGSAEAADLVDEAVRYAKQRKPVVVRMGQVAVPAVIGWHGKVMPILPLDFK